MSFGGALGGNASGRSVRSLRPSGALDNTIRRYTTTSYDVHTLTSLPRLILYLLDWLPVRDYCAFDGCLTLQRIAR